MADGGINIGGKLLPTRLHPAGVLLTALTPTKAADGTLSGEDPILTAFRAPKQAELALVLSVGLQAKNYPGDGIYMTINALEAGKYANSYGAGVLVISTPTSVVNQLYSGGHIQVDKLVPGAFNVLPSGISMLNQHSTITHIPPGSYELYDQFGAY